MERAPVAGGSRRALALPLAVTGLAFLVGYWQKASCYAAAWPAGNRLAYAESCYSDIPVLFRERGLIAGIFPYAPESWRHPLEYPVLTGLVMDVDRATDGSHRVAVRHSDPRHVDVAQARCAGKLTVPYVCRMTDDVALLLRRAGFGPTAAELSAARQTGWAATLAGLTAPTGPDIGATSAPVPDLGIDPYARTPNPTPARRARADDIRRDENERISRWWLDRMTIANHQAVEKLLFFWHGHWATSVVKVKSAQLMLAQHVTMRQSRDFADMARRMVVDPALVYWLDGQLNTKASANENLGRELLELFMLGIGHYTEQDVKAAGRALTGWRIDLRDERCVFEAREHDAGGKTILGRTQKFDARSLVDHLLRQPACRRFVATRLWYRYGSSTRPIPESTLEKMSAEFPGPLAMLRALFEDEAVRETRDTMVKQPVEWLVGAMRQIGVRPAGMPDETFRQILAGMNGLGQRPFAPPSVGGWTAGAAWLTSAAAQVRLSLAGKLASLLTPEKLTPEDVAYILGIDKWTNRTYSVLREVHNSRLLLTLGLVSPEYLVT